MIKNMLILAIALLIGLPAQAAAHRLNVFAWLENDQIIVECNFGRDRPARNADIRILDNTDQKVLLSGKTTENGAYIFTVPPVVRQGHGLLIEVNAGQGHRGEFEMNASELYAAASLTAGFDEAAIQARDEDKHIHIQTAPRTPGIAMPQGPLSEEQITNIVQNALELKLAPIRQELAAANSSGPRISEILGGIGWIIGLVGVAMYFKSRHKA